MTDYRDGQRHQVGPITLQYLGENVVGLEAAACTICTEEGTEYLLDFEDAETFAIAFRAFPDLFSASESDKDKEPNERGERRGFLRFRASNAARHGALASRAKNEVYQVARVIADATDEEEVQPVTFTDEGRRDYRRAALKRDFSPRARTSTRLAFVDRGICDRIRILHGDEAAAAMRRELLGRFAAADYETGDPRVIGVEPGKEGRPTSAAWSPT